MSNIQNAIFRIHVAALTILNFAKLKNQSNQEYIYSSIKFYFSSVCPFKTGKYVLIRNDQENDRIKRRKVGEMEDHGKEKRKEDSILNMDFFKKVSIIIKR